MQKDQEPPTSVISEQPQFRDSASPEPIEPDGTDRSFPGLNRALLFMAALQLIIALVIDVVIIGRDFTLKSPPDFSPLYLVRMGLLASVAMFVVAAAAIFPQKDSPPDTSPISIFLPVTAASALIVTFTALFLIDPLTFSTLGSEEHLIEWVGQGLLFVAAAVLLARTIRLRRAADRLRFYLSAGLTVVIFLICMEEISWFQRVMGIEKPPPIFAGNLQEEINFHNFLTHPIEMAYYAAAYALLILIPFLNQRFGLLNRVASLAELVPAKAILLLAAPLAFLNFADWNRMPEQTAAFLTLFILGYYVIELRKAGQNRGAMVMGIFIAVLVTVQAVFILGGENLTRFWQTTEYKELFISIGLAAYAVQLWRSSRGLGRSESNGS